MSNLTFNGFYEGVPYTNFQTLNLDCVYSRINGILEILSQTNPDIKNSMLFANNREELASTHYEPGTYVFAMGKDKPGDAGAALYKISPADGSYTPGAFSVASGKAVLQADNSVNIAQLASADFADAFNWACENFKIVYIPLGEYSSNKTLIIRDNIVIGSDDVQAIPSEPRVLIRAKISVEGAAYIQGLYCEGYETGLSGAGFTINNRCKLVGCVSQYWDIGFHVTTNSFMVGLTFDTCRASNCKNYGFYIEGTNNSSKNITTIRNCYANNCGNNYSNYSAPGEETNGHGYFIKQGLTLIFTGNTAEYNTGYGLLLEPSFRSNSDFSYIDGATITSNYFEQNKIAQIGLNADTYGSVKNSTFADNYFVMPLGPVSNTKPNWRYDFKIFDVFSEDNNNNIDDALFEQYNTYRSFSPIASQYCSTAYQNVFVTQDNNESLFNCRYASPGIARVRGNMVYSVSFNWSLKSGAKYILEIQDGAGTAVKRLILTGDGNTQRETFYFSCANDGFMRFKFTPYQGTPESIYFSHIEIVPTQSIYITTGDDKPQHPQYGCVSLETNGTATIYNGSTWASL